MAKKKSADECDKLPDPEQPVVDYRAAEGCENCDECDKESYVLVKYNRIYLYKGDEVREEDFFVGGYAVTIDEMSGFFSIKDRDGNSIAIINRDNVHTIEIL